MSINLQAVAHDASLQLAAVWDELGVPASERAASLQALSVDVAALFASRVEAAGRRRAAVAADAASLCGMITGLQNALEEPAPVVRGARAGAGAGEGAAAAPTTPADSLTAPRRPPPRPPSRSPARRGSLCSRTATCSRRGARRCSRCAARGARAARAAGVRGNGRPRPLAPTARAASPPRRSHPPPHACARRCGTLARRRSTRRSRPSRACARRSARPLT